ncbi:hypothetical protein ACQ4M4_16710 [Leptolyngbya sp. AN02str]|uniref:hypothetical protein n=1 Tax=Leptolyngbya sp. AN02str TaxID=3423363 RepID=UPI003D314EC9
MGIFLKLIGTTLVMGLQLAAIQASVAVALPLAQPNSESMGVDSVAALNTLSVPPQGLQNSSPPYSPPVEGGPGNTQGSGTR